MHLDPKYRPSSSTFAIFPDSFLVQSHTPWISATIWLHEFPHFFFFFESQWARVSFFLFYSEVRNSSRIVLRKMKKISRQLGLREVFRTNEELPARNPAKIFQVYCPGLNFLGILRKKGMFFPFYLVRTHICKRGLFLKG